MSRGKPTRTRDKEYHPRESNATMPLSPRRKWLQTELIFSVQDRRSRARALQQIRENKSALLGLTTRDVARRLQAMHPPYRIMDNCSGSGKDKKEEKAKSPSHIYPDNTSPRFRPPMSYEEWLEEGFPVSCWRPLLLTELYHPLEAEQKRLSVKYSVAPREKDKASNATAKKGAKQ
ncbi:hypothetical protein TraAM80_02897 [Trypanosoma rangeli]|uniref:Uncharacterized protein n=1 Tax=Trypanosoma rangeli TaxID=5698 RepID=A0A422NRN6_TRYRA|nr:uncharacterized protein TraAM80_02897 [Trypanosoma rangeli]RNF08140.1 hypothetical protein TraAM80_02897 [Trypanosoma rangeli]|eukprot:RNF08140.1 hypothetical protein TraAM80_02897 [Trypanosoma rangeli]